MLIGDIQRLSLIDYPDKVACTVFLAGCSFRCPWCYNSELVLPEKIRELYPISEQKLLKFLKQRKNLLEGVVLGGGEPTIQPDLIDFCKKIKKLKYAIKLDTNGSNPDILEKLINKKLVDYIALDIKAPPKKYIKVIGLENRIIPDGIQYDFWTERIVNNIKKSVNLLKEENIDYEFRTTVVPTVHRKTDILKIAKWLSPAKKYFLQEFRPTKTVNPQFEKVKPHKKDYLLGILKSIEPLFETCQIRS